MMKSGNLSERFFCTQNQENSEDKNHDYQN